MKMRPRLFLLVLAAACVCRGQNQTATLSNRNTDPTMEDSTTPMPSHQNQTLANQPDVLPTGTGQTLGTQGETKTPRDKVHHPDEQKPTTSAEGITALSTMALSATTEAASSVGSHSSWGYVLLVLLLLVIVILLIILYLLRRASRTYSFDLQREASGNNAGEPAGNFEVLYLDDEGQETPCDRSMSPVANGMAPQSEEHAPQEETHVDHSQASDIGDIAILVHSPKKSDPLDAAEKKPKQDDITPTDSNGLFDEKDPNEPLNIASPSLSPSSYMDR